MNTIKILEKLGNLTTQKELEARRERVIDLDAQGYTEREIAALLDVSEQTIWNDMKALRSDPAYFRGRIHNLFQRAMNQLDMKDPQDRRCFFTNIAHLVGKTMPIDTNMQLKGETKVLIQWNEPSQSIINPIQASKPSITAEPDGESSTQEDASAKPSVEQTKQSNNPSSTDQSAKAS